MHADQCAANVQASIRPDLLQGHGMLETVVSRCGEGAPCLGLGHHVTKFRLAGCLSLYNDARFRCSQHWAAR